MSLGWPTASVARWVTSRHWTPTARTTKAGCSLHAVTPSFAITVLVFVILERTVKDGGFARDDDWDPRDLPVAQLIPRGVALLDNTSCHDVS